MSVLRLLQPVGYVHFRFSMDGELRGEMTGAPALWVFNFQLEPSIQRKGLGRHIMSLLELVGRKHAMQSLQVVTLAVRTLSVPSLQLVVDLHPRLWSHIFLTGPSLLPLRSRWGPVAHTSAGR